MSANKSTAASISSILSSPPPTTVKFKLSEAMEPSPMATVVRRASKSPYRPSQNPVFMSPTLATPNGVDRSRSAIALSPSNTIREVLTELAASTAQKLEEVWDEVGYSPDERASQLSDLLIKFRDLCEAKISEERGVADTYRQTISDAKEEMRKTGEALKTLVDSDLLNDNSGQTLMDELATIETALVKLRAEASAARDDLKTCLDALEESHRALGLKMDKKWFDIDSDLTAARREEFHRKVLEMKEEVASRTVAIVQLVKDCQHLMDDLRIDPETSGSDLDKRIAGSLVRSKDGSFIMASKFKTERCTGISSESFEELTSRVAFLSGEKRRRKAKLQEMGTTIAVLWEKLRVPEEDQRAFTQSVQGLGNDTLEKGEAEMKRLYELKAKMLGELIAEARETISYLWDDTNATDEQRSSFQPYNVSDEERFDDDLLEKHEQYIGVLQLRLEQMKPMLRLIERREDIIRERMEYEELQKDPDRLKQRGAAMAGQLMKEEKMARRIKRDLPKLTQLLEEKLQEWNTSHGEDFLYKGESYLNIMDMQEATWREYKENELQLKLKKKQEEKALVENRYNSSRSTSRKKAASGAHPHPLTDGRNNQNTRHPSRSRSRHVDAAVKKSRPPSRSRSQRRMET